MWAISSPTRKASWAWASSIPSGSSRYGAAEPVADRFEHEVSMATSLVGLEAHDRYRLLPSRLGDPLQTFIRAGIQDLLGIDTTSDLKLGRVPAEPRPVPLG